MTNTTVSESIFGDAPIQNIIPEAFTGTTISLPSANNFYNISAWVDPFLSYLEHMKKLGKGTIYCYRKYLKFFMKFCTHYGVVDIRTLNLMHVQTYNEVLAKKEVTGQDYEERKEKRFLDPNTIAYYMRAVRMYLKFCKANRIDCIDHELIAIPKTKNKPLQILDSEDVFKVIDAPLMYESKTLLAMRNHLLLLTGYLTGLRISEALKLNMKEVLEQEYVEVIGKGDRRAKVRIPEIIKVLARDYQLARQHKGDFEPLFICHNNMRLGERLEYDGVRAFLRKYYDKGLRVCGEKRFHYHLLRHAFATRLLELKVNMPTVQHMMRHADIKSTQFYSHVDYGTLADVQDLIVEDYCSRKGKHLE